VHDIEHAGRQPGFGKLLCNEKRRGWIALGRLQHKRVAARERHRKHPHRHHDWKVERRNTCDDPEWLAYAVAVNARSHVLAHFALLRRADSEFDDFQATLDLALRIRDACRGLRAAGMLLKITKK
jgi:hypothetical protein